MPGRNYQSASAYRYGFNGKENDKEVKGNGNSLDFGARIYDPRLGKWLSVDPLQAKYPFLSPYNFVANNPINSIDPDGRSIKPVNKDAELLLKATFDSFGGENFAAALNITSRNGNVRSNLITADGAMMNPRKFKKTLRDNHIRLRGDDLKDAYNLYKTLQSGEKTELAVFSKEVESNTRKEGSSGTKLVEGESKSNNANFNEFSEKFDKKNSVIDEVTNGKKYGTLEYKAQNANDPDISNKGTLIIDASGEKPKESVKTLKQALKPQ